MAFMSAEERDELVDMVAQAVIDRIEERDRIHGLADLVVERVLALQHEEHALREAEGAKAQGAKAQGAKAPGTKGSGGGRSASRKGDR